MGAHLLVIALGGTLVLGLYHGFRGGLIRSAFKLLGLIAGLLLARPLADALAPNLADWFDFTGGSLLLVLLCFGVITAAFALAGWLLSLLIRWTPLVWLDRAGGAALGLLMGLLLCAVVLNLLEHLEVLETVLEQATGWERSFLDLVRATAPDLFDELRAFVLPVAPRGDSI